MYLYVTYENYGFYTFPSKTFCGLNNLLAIQILHLTLSLEMNLLLGIEVLC